MAVENEQGGIIPKIKISENVEKITNPGFKDVYRLYERTTGKAIADVLVLRGETIDDSKPYEIFDPEHTWKRKLVRNFTARKILEPLFVDGKCVYQERDVKEIQAYCSKQVATLWSEVCRFENPHRYYVDLS